MRVISGSAKGKRLATVKDASIRPTADKVKMALFNVLQHGVINFNFEGCTTLDMFSGSGSLGIGSLSRGSEFCFFLDVSRELVNILEFVTRNDLLNSDGILVIEDDIRAELKLNNNFKLIEKKNYGKTQLIFLTPN